MLTSIRTTSGWRRRTSVIAASAFSAVPTTSMSASKLRSFVRLSTVEGTSSMMTTRMGEFSGVAGPVLCSGLRPGEHFREDRERGDDVARLDAVGGAQADALRVWSGRRRRVVLVGLQLVANRHVVLEPVDQLRLAGIHDDRDAARGRGGARGAVVPVVVGRGHAQVGLADAEDVELREHRLGDAALAVAIAGEDRDVVARLRKAGDTDQLACRQGDGDVSGGDREECGLGAP